MNNYTSVNPLFVLYIIHFQKCLSSGDGFAGSHVPPGDDTVVGKVYQCQAGLG